MSADLRERVARAWLPEFDFLTPATQAKAIRHADAVLSAIEPYLATPETQRAITEAAERRGYERARAEFEPFGYVSDPAPQPQAEPVAALLTNPYTGTPRDYRDVESDPAGVLIQESGAPVRAAAPQPQQQARQHVNLSGLVAQAFATECWRAQPHASDYEIADAILEKLAPYLAAQHPKPQASAEDVALVDRAMRGPIYNGSPQLEAWQRIRASLGVGS